MIQVLTVSQALLEVNVSLGGKLEASLHLSFCPCRTGLDAVLQFAQEANDLPVLLRVLVNLLDHQLVPVSDFLRLLRHHLLPFQVVHLEALQLAFQHRHLLIHLLLQRIHLHNDLGGSLDHVVGFRHHVGCKRTPLLRSTHVSKLFSIWIRLLFDLGILLPFLCSRAASSFTLDLFLFNHKKIVDVLLRHSFFSLWRISLQRATFPSSGRIRDLRILFRIRIVHFHAQIIF